MQAYLPDYYGDIREMQALLGTEGLEMDGLYLAADDTLDQFFVGTADWGLAMWEEELGIPVDIAKPVDQRRSVVKSKRRGVGKVSASLLERVAEAYDRGRVNVTVQPALNQLTVTFVDTTGFPPNLADVKAAVEETKPAHLQVKYQFRYLMLSEVEQMTIAQLEATMLDKFAWG